MYLPFWVYDSDATSTYTGRGGRFRRVTDKEGKTRTVTDWFPVSGTVSRSFNDIQIIASDKQDNVKGILPFNTEHNTEPFSLGFFSGYYAEVYRIPADTAFGNAKSIMEREMRMLAASDIERSFDTSEVHNLNTTYSNSTYRHILLPMWASAFRYKGRNFNYAVNGETGKVSGERPYSAVKIAAAVIAAIIALILIATLTGAVEGNAVTASSAMEANVIKASMIQTYEVQASEIQENEIQANKIQDYEIQVSRCMFLASESGFLASGCEAIQVNKKFERMCI